MRVRLDTIISPGGLRFEASVLASDGSTLAVGGERDTLRDAIDAALLSAAYVIEHLQAPIAIKALTILRDGLGGCRGGSS